MPNKRFRFRNESPLSQEDDLMPAATIREFTTPAFTAAEFTPPQIGQRPRIRRNSTMR